MLTRSTFALNYAWKPYVFSFRVYHLQNGVCIPTVSSVYHFRNYLIFFLWNSMFCLQLGSFILMSIRCLVFKFQLNQVDFNWSDSVQLLSTCATFNVEFDGIQLESTWRFLSFLSQCLGFKSSLSQSVRCLGFKFQLNQIDFNWSDSVHLVSICAMFNVEFDEIQLEPIWRFYHFSSMWSMFNCFQ